MRRREMAAVVASVSRSFIWETCFRKSFTIFGLFHHEILPTSGSRRRRQFSVLTFLVL